MIPYSPRPTGASLSDSRSEARNTLAVPRRNSSAAGSPYSLRISAMPLTLRDGNPRVLRSSTAPGRAVELTLEPGRNHGAGSRRPAYPRARQRSGCRSGPSLARCELGSIPSGSDILSPTRASYTRSGPQMAKDLTVFSRTGPASWRGWAKPPARPGSTSRGCARSPARARGSSICWSTTTRRPRRGRALEDAGMGVADEREVLVVDVEDRPGTLGELARSAWRGQRQHRARLHDLRRRQARDRDRRHRQRPRRARLSRRLGPSASPP